MIKQFNIRSVKKSYPESQDYPYKNIRVIASPAGKGKTKVMFQKALKYCAKGYTIYYFDLEGSLNGRLFHSYMHGKNCSCGYRDEDLFNIDNIPKDSFYLIRDSYKYEELIMHLASIEKGKNIIMLDTPSILFKNRTEFSNFLRLISVLGLKTFITMQTNRQGTSVC